MANSFTTQSKVPCVNDFVALLKTTQVQLIDAWLHSKSFQARAYDAQACDMVPSRIFSLVISKKYA